MLTAEIRIHNVKRSVCVHWASILSERQCQWRSLVSTAATAAAALQRIDPWRPTWWNYWIPIATHREWSFYVSVYVTSHCFTITIITHVLLHRSTVTRESLTTTGVE